MSPDGAIGDDTMRVPQPDTCDYPGCYKMATVWTAAGTKYCGEHAPDKRPVGLGMFKSDTELTGLEIKPKRKR